MKKLLQIECLKIYKYSTFRIFIALYILAVVLAFLFVKFMSLKINMGPTDFNILNTTLTFPKIWGFSGFINSMAILIICFILILLISNEYTFKTARQNVIDGQSRLDFFHAQWLKVFVFALFATLVYIIGTVLANLLNQPNFSQFLDGAKKIPLFFIQCINYFGFVTMLTLIFRKSALSILVFLFYSFFIENFIFLIWFKNKNWTQEYKFLPLESSDSFFPGPWYEFGKMAGMTTEIYNSNLLILMSIVWIVLYFFISRFWVLKKDL